jgi:aminoglycoside N3'-acetyltransferase
MTFRLPRGLLKRVYHHRIVQALRSESKRLVRRRRSQVQTRDLLISLTAAGVKQGDVLLVHASLGGLGNVEGGAATVVNALLASVGTEGTVLMPAHPATSFPRERLLNDVFIVTETPSITGAISEEMRRRNGCVRSAHPTHSVIGIGPRAAELLSKHHLDPTPFGTFSPYRLLAEVGGKVLGLGLDIRWFTIYHVVEEDPDYPIKVYLDAPVNAKVQIEGAPMTVVTTQVHDPAVSAARLDSWKARREKIRRALRTHGGLYEGECRGAEVNAITASEVLRVLRILAREKETIYEPTKINR